MDKLRAKNNLIYGIDIIHTINDYSTIIKVNINVSNENAKKTLDRFVKLIKDNFKNIDNKFLEGIKKNMIYSYNKNNLEDKCLFYEICILIKYLTNVKMI